MCFTEEVSLALFVVGMVSALFLAIMRPIYGNDRYLSVITAIVVGVVSVMQLLEYFMWTDQDCGSTNRHASISTVVFLWIQALAFVTLPFCLVDNARPPFSGWMGAIVLLDFIIFPIWIQRSVDRDALCSLEDIDSHRLKWDVFEDSTVVITVFFIAYLSSMGMYCYTFVYRQTSGNPTWWAFWQSFWTCIVVFVAAIIWTVATASDVWYTVIAALWCFLSTVGSAVCIFWAGREWVREFVMSKDPPARVTLFPVRPRTSALRL